MPVILEEEGGAGVTKTTSTNASGHYEFTDLVPGKDRVEASLPDIYHQYVLGRRPFVGGLREARGCSEVNLHAAYDGRVSGRLLDARGAPVAGVSISLLDAHDPDSPVPVLY